MSIFIKNPIIAPEIDNTPPSPPPGTRGIFPTSNGWKDIDSNGVISDIGGTGAGTGTGDMKQSVYDADGDGIVDNAKTLDGKDLGAITAEFAIQIDNATAPIEEKASAAGSLAGNAMDKADMAYSLAAGANQAKTFENYKEFIEWVNVIPIIYPFTDPSMISGTYVSIGNNILIKTLNVPDLWVMEYAEDEDNGYSNYVDTSNMDADEVDSEIVNLLNEQGFFYTKWLKIGQLETQKVDLTEYYTKDETETKISDAIGDVNTALENIIAKYGLGGDAL